MKKILYIILGSISFCIGAVGIFIPLLPTAPLLLLAAFFYFHSSQRMYDWLTGHRILGEHIKNYQQYRAISKRTKIYTLAFLWASLTVSFILVGITAVRIVLPIVGVAISAHILCLKTLNNE